MGHGMLWAFIFSNRHLNYHILLLLKEIDPNGGITELPDDIGGGEGFDLLTILILLWRLNVIEWFFLDIFTAGKAMLQEMVGSFPGIDEAVSFSEVMKCVHFFRFYHKHSLHLFNSI